MIRKILVVVCGLLAFQGYVFAETWEDRAARNAPWSAEFPDDPACWNADVEWDAEYPWIVGIGKHFLFEDFVDCYRFCAKNNTCYRIGWAEEDIASAPCSPSSDKPLRERLNPGYGMALGNHEISKSVCK